MLKDQVVGLVAPDLYPPLLQFALVIDTAPPLFESVKLVNVGIDDTGAALLLVNVFVVVRVIATLVMLVYDKDTLPDTLKVLLPAP